jgi:hypothetical protein
MDECAGLSRPRAGDDQQRAVVRNDGLALGGIEAVRCGCSGDLGPYFRLPRFRLACCFRFRHSRLLLDSKTTKDRGTASGKGVLSAGEWMIENSAMRTN